MGGGGGGGGGEEEGDKKVGVMDSYTGSYM